VVISILTASFFFFRGLILMDIIFHHRVRLDHSPPPWDAHPDWFITLCCSIRGTNQFCLPETSKALLDSACFYHRKGIWCAELFPLMPDHLHALVSISDRRPLDKTIRDWKRWTARHLKIQWQTGFFEHRLRSYESADQKYKYILNNPVRAGLVSRPEEWPHSFVGNSYDRYV
jgi:REP element-mobilizing transposase RayT